jgi:hypothetical protein
MGNLNKKIRKRNIFKYYEMILLYFLVYLFIIFLFNLNIVDCVNKRKYFHHLMIFQWLLI